MFLDNLYTLTRSDASDIFFGAEVKLIPDHHLFAGHFPGLPVLPGVVQLQMVKELLEKHFEKKMRMKQMRTCKFLQIINPQEIQDLRIEVKFTNPGDMDATLSITGNEHIFLKAQIQYAFA